MRDYAGFETFKLGDVFKLTPDANMTWIVIQHLENGVKAVDASSDYGKMVLRWIDAGRPSGEPVRQLKIRLPYEDPRLFYASKLENAETVTT